MVAAAPMGIAVMAMVETRRTDLSPPGGADGGLTAALVASGHRRAAVSLAGKLAKWAWIVLAGLLPMLVLDAIWPIQESARCVLTVLMLLTAGVGLARVGRRDRHRQPWHEAAVIERHFGLSHNPLLNALWLRETPAHSELAAALARRTIGQGRDMARDPRLKQSINRRLLWRQGVMLLAVALVWLAASVACPRLIFGGLARFADPWGDHPRFSLTMARMNLQPAEPIAGQDVLVRVELSGHPPRNADLVEVDGRGRELGRRPMDLVRGEATAAVFGAKLLALREPIVVEVQWSAGRSHRLVITPRRPAEPVQPRAATPNTAGAAPVSDDARALLRALAARTGAMAEAAERLRAWAARMQEQEEDQPGDLSNWRQQLERQAMRGADLRGLLSQLQNAGSAALDTPARDLLARLDMDLHHLRLTPSAAAPSWDQAVGAAEGDGRLLDADARDLAQLIDGHAAGTAGQRPAAGAGVPGAGNISESITPGQTPYTGNAALAAQAPEIYRDLVGRYYNRLAADSTPATGPDATSHP
jgi:hypothetical protein